MDPKQNPPLDPKLKEAYDRVMGFSVGDLTSAPQASTAQQDISAPTNLTQPSPSQDPLNPTLPLTADPLAPSAAPVASAIPITTLPDTTLPSTTADVTATQNPMETMPSAALSPTQIQAETTADSPVLSQDPIPSPVSPEPPAPQLAGIPEVPSAPLPTPDMNVPSSSQTPDSLAAAMPLPAAVHATETVHVGALSNANDTKKAGKKGISPLIILFGGIVLLLAYILFWVRVFNLPIPFISQ